MPLILFFDGSLSRGCSWQSSVFHSYFISQNVCNFFHMLHFENATFNLHFPERNTNLRLLFFIGVNILSSVWSKYPPLNEAGDHATFSDLAERISGPAFKHLAESICACLQPTLPKTVWAVGSSESIVVSAMAAPRQAIELEPGARVSADVHAERFLASDCLSNHGECS